MFHARSMVRPAMLKLPGLGIVYCTNVRAGSRNDEISFYGLYVLHKRPLVLKLLQCRKLILSAMTQ